MMTTPIQEITHDNVVQLLHVCQDGEWLFNLAARGTTEPMLRAELNQYAAQRRDFISELHEALHEAGEDLHDEIMPVDSVPSDTLRRAVSDNDHAAILAECEREEALAAESYRQVVAAGLPYVVGGVVYSQFQAVMRVHDRIQSLAATALETQG